MNAQAYQQAKQQALRRGIKGTKPRPCNPWFNKIRRLNPTMPIEQVRILAVNMANR